MPKLIKPVTIKQDIIEIPVDGDCHCAKCKSNDFFSMTPYRQMKSCKKKDSQIITRFPGRITYSTCILEFNNIEFIPIPDISSVYPYIPKQKYEFDIGGKTWIYHGVFTLHNELSTPLIYECSVDWIEPK